MTRRLVPARARSASWLASVPDGMNTAASLPSSWAQCRSNASTSPPSRYVSCAGVTFRHRASSSAVYSPGVIPTPSPERWTVLSGATVMVATSAVGDSAAKPVATPIASTNPRLVTGCMCVLRCGCWQHAGLARRHCRRRGVVDSRLDRLHWPNLSVRSRRQGDAGVVLISTVDCRSPCAAATPASALWLDDLGRPE